MSVVGVNDVGMSPFFEAHSSDEFVVAIKSVRFDDVNNEYPWKELYK